MYSDNADQDFGYLLEIVEPIFALLIGMVAALSGESFAFVIAIGLLQGLLLMQLIKSSRSPVDFLMIYIGIFYLSFQFNVLRAGTGILFLLMASRVPREERNQAQFYFFGVAAVLSHYSTLLAFIPMLFLRIPLSNPKALIPAISLMTAGAYYFLVFSWEAIGAKYLIYSDLLAPDVTNTLSMTFILGLPIYLAIFTTAVTRKKWIGLAFLLAVWIGLRWLTSIFSLAGRVEMIVNAMLLFYMIEIPSDGWRKKLRGFSVSVLTVMWVAAALFGLANEDKIMTNLDVVSDVYLSSPFTPYHFIWEIK